MSSPIDPEELFDQTVPQLSQQLVDRLLDVATEYLACMASLEALSASSDDPAVRDVAAGNYGNQLTTQRLNEIPRNTSYCNSLRSQSSHLITFILPSNNNFYRIRQPHYPPRLEAPPNPLG